MMQLGSLKFQPTLVRLTAIALCLGVIGQSTNALAGFKPKRGIGRSNQRIGLASRGGCAVAPDSKPLTTIVPLSTGVTANALPALPWFMPQHSYPSTEVRLLAESEEFGMEIIHRQVLESLPKNQVVSYDLATAGIPPLEAGKTYKWQVHLVCNPDMPSGNLFAEGWLEYEPASTELSTKMESVSPKNQANLWLKNGYWYDGITAMLTQPEEGTASTEWQSLMNDEQVNLPHLAILPTKQASQDVSPDGVE